MTNQPNIKKTVLDHVIVEVANGRGPAVSLRALARDKRWDTHRIAKASNELYPAVNHGTSVMAPWLWERTHAEQLYESWNAEPPAEINEVEWVDE